MHLSRESEYGLRGLIFLARQLRQKPVLLANIAAAEGLPRHFLAKTFSKLSQHGVVRSHRGAMRGYTLMRAPQEINVKEVLEAIEGAGLFSRCILWDADCLENSPCTLDCVWQEIRPKLVERLEKITLADLARQAKKKHRGAY